MRRPVTLHGHDDEAVGDRGRRGQEPSGVRLPSELAGPDRDGVDVPGVVAEERGVSVDRDAGATDRVELDRGVPHRLLGVEVDRRGVGIERTTVGSRRRRARRAGGAGRRGAARPRRGVVPKPSLQRGDPSLRGDGDGGRHGWSVVAIDAPELPAAREIRGDDLRREPTAITDDPSTTGCERPKSPGAGPREGRRGATTPCTAAGRHPRGNPCGPRRPAFVSTRRSPAPTRPRRAANHPRTIAKRTRAPVKGGDVVPRRNELGVAQSRAILGGAGRSDAQPVNRAIGASRIRSTTLAGPEVVERVDVLPVQAHAEVHVRCGVAEMSGAGERDLAFPLATRSSCGRGPPKGTNTSTGGRPRDRS